METQLVIFLAFVSIALITNTLLIFLVYKALSGVTSKVTEGVSAVVTASEINEWMTALQSASEQAVAVTEATKVRMAECQPVIENVQKTYQAALKKVDSTMETVADEVAQNAKKVRDVVARPAFSFIAFAAGLTQMFENFESEE
jgi:hypothetical protein